MLRKLYQIYNEDIIKNKIILNGSKILSGNISQYQTNYLFKNLLKYIKNEKIIDIILDILTLKIKNDNNDPDEPNNEFNYIIITSYYFDTILKIMNYYPDNYNIITKGGYIYMFLVSFEHNFFTSKNLKHIFEVINKYYKTNNNITEYLFNILSNVCIGQFNLIQYIYSDNYFNKIQTYFNNAYINDDILIMISISDIIINCCFDINFLDFIINSDFYENLMKIFNKLNYIKINSYEEFNDINNLQRNCLYLLYNTRYEDKFKSYVFGYDIINILYTLFEIYPNYINDDDFILITSEILDIFNQDISIKTYTFHMLIKHASIYFITYLMNNFNYDYYFNIKDENNMYPLDYAFNRDDIFFYLVNKGCYNIEQNISYQYKNNIKKIKEKHKKYKAKITKFFIDTNNILITDVCDIIINFLPNNSLKQFKIELK